KFDLLADNIHSCAEPLLPVVMAEHGHGRRRGVIVRVRDRASQYRLYSETCVITAGNELPADAFRLIVRHSGQSEYRCEGEEVAERVLSRGGARLPHLLDDVVAENRSPAHAS